MTPPPDISEAAASLVRRLSKTLLSLVATPAAVVTEAGRVVATNGAWEELVGFQPTSSGPPELGPEIGECLRGFDRVESLLHQLGSGSQTGAGVATLLRPRGPSMQEDSRRECVARWREVEAPGLGRKYTLVVLAAPETDVSHLVSVINAQRVTIDDLLIRQTLIEERERRRLGRALHDGLAQELALIRARVINTSRSGDMTTRLVQSLDEVIGSVRGLTFELSPPILEDLGVRPALHWLAEHLGHRYGTSISVADDGADPRLSPSARTIVFRAVRELAINAAKHAGNAEIVVSCVTGTRTARFTVRDTGPGIDPSVVDRCSDGVGRFGLISVEQQIRGIGGSFDIVSRAGDGTRAIITVPLEPEGEAAAHD